MIALLQISWRMWQWKNFENRPEFDEVMRRLRWLRPICVDYGGLNFFAHPIQYIKIKTYKRIMNSTHLVLSSP